MPPPPWELLVTVKPSMLDGLQEKLLGYRLLWDVMLGTPVVALTVKVWQNELASPVGIPPVPLVAPGLLTPLGPVLNRNVPGGNAPASVPSLQMLTPVG